MVNEEWNRYYKRREFDGVSQDQRKRIIKFCSMIMQQVDKSDSKLRENKENLKAWIFKNETAKKVGFDIAQQEITLVDLVGNYMIENKDRFISLSTYARERKLLEEMADIGLIEGAEIIKKETETKPGKGGVNPNNDLNATDSAEPTHGAQVIPIEKLKQHVKGQTNVSQGIQAGQTLATEQQKRLSSKGQSSLLQQRIDLSKLNKPDLLLTNKKTGQKQIKYGRYSEAKRMPYKFNYQGTPIQITRVGRLEYKTSLMLIADIDEYLVQTPNGENDVFTYGLEIGKIESDEQYRKVFFEQLIDDANMNLFSGNGYIGSIVETKDKQEKYKVEYSEEEYTAVTELKQRLEKMKQRKISGDKDDR